MIDTCEYFTRYGNEGVPGSCASRPALVLHDNAADPRIRVCHLHARTIVGRFPGLGDITHRFSPVTAAG